MRLRNRYVDYLTVRPGKSPCPAGKVGQGAAPVIFARRGITPESTVTPSPQDGLEVKLIAGYFDEHE